MLNERCEPQVKQEAMSVFITSSVGSGNETNSITALISVQIDALQDVDAACGGTYVRAPENSSIVRALTFTVQCVYACIQTHG